MLGRFKMVTTVSEWSLISSDLLSFKKIIKESYSYSLFLVFKKVGFS